MPNNTRQQWIDERIAVLAGSASPSELEEAARELASSDDPAALEALGTFLRQSDFLDRLDAAEDPGGKTVHLRAVLAPLIERASPEAVRLCLTLVDEPVYLADDRKSFLLEAMARVVPMNAATVEAFRRANEEGYFAFDALLLARNESPRALDLFSSMMGESEIDNEAKTELLHKAIMPRRTHLPILQMVASLMTKGLEAPVVLAAIESVFDYQKTWFKIHAPMPPGWRTASDDVLRYVIELAKDAKRRPDLPAPLMKAIDETVEIVGALLARRAA